MFRKHTDEIKKEVDNLVENGKVLSVGILAVTCLTVGYIMGAITTGAMCRTIAVVR